MRKVIEHVPSLCYVIAELADAAVTQSKAAVYGDRRALAHARTPLESVWTLLFCAEASRFQLATKQRGKWSRPEILGFHSAKLKAANSTFSQHCWKVVDAPMRKSLQSSTPSCVPGTEFRTRAHQRTQQTAMSSRLAPPPTPSVDHAATLQSPHETPERAFCMPQPPPFWAPAPAPAPAHPPASAPARAPAPTPAPTSKALSPFVSGSPSACRSFADALRELRRRALPT